jgi:enoyl-CoA hydratase/carnithine racemase
MTQAVLFETRDEAVAVITINRPEARNALGREVREGLFAAWKRFEDDAALRVAILTGAGDQAFCAGGDLREMMETGLTVPPPDMFPIPGRNVRLTKPTIAAVNGAAYAGGFLMAQCCDLCVASETARFAITEAKVGRGSPWAAPLIHMLPQRIMLELLLTGDPMSARQLYELGFLNRVVPPERVMAEALALAGRIAANAPLTVGACRAMVYAATECGRTAALEQADALFRPVYLSADAQEGPRAFAEKRAPRWSGR